MVKKFFGFKQQVEVEGWCSECFGQVPDPKAGCGRCVPGKGLSILDLQERPG